MVIRAIVWQNRSVSESSSAFVVVGTSSESSSAFVVGMAALAEFGAPPAACAVYDSDATSACVMWSAAPRAASYAVQMREVGAEAWTTLSTTLKATKVRKNKLAPSTAYEFRVAAVDGGGAVGEYSGVAAVASREGVEQQPAPVVSGVDGEGVTVSWSGGVGPYALQYAAEEDLGQDSATPWKLAAASVTGTAAKKRNLEGGKRYAFRVKPADAAGYDWSRASEAALIPRPAPFMSRCFGTDLVNRGGATKATGPSLAGKVVAVYASANW